MATPANSPPLPPHSPPPPTEAASQSPSTLKRTRKATRLRSLATRPARADRPVVPVDPGTGKPDGPHKKKLRTYLGIVARDKVDLTYENWKQAKFDIPEASDIRTKKKILQTMGERWRQFKFDLTSKWALAANMDNVDDTKYFRSAPWTFYTSSSMAPEELEQLTQQIKDQLEELIIEKVTRRMMSSFSQMQSQFQSQMQSQGLALPPEPEVGPSAACVSTNESCVDPSGNDPDTVYEGSTTVHNIPLLHDQVKVGVEEVKDADAPVSVPTNEGAVGPAKPVDRPDHEVMWDATVFGVFNEDFPLYIKHEDLSEIAHGGNFDVYGFIEPQSIQRSGQSQFESKSYMKNWMQNSKWDVYLGAYMNGLDNYVKGIINMSVLFFNAFALSLLSNINILMFLVFNNALKGLNDTPQPKSKAGARWILVKCNRQKGSTECDYYVMHWMSTIILGTFRNNWETTIGSTEIEGASHPMGTVLSQS
ncbi:hypothetical protein HKD37_01G001925 [Glycine soja]